VGVAFNVRGSQNSRRIRLQVNRLGALRIQFKGNLLQVQNDVSSILDDSRNRGKFMQNTFDLDCGDCSSFNRGQQDPSQGFANGCPKTTLKRLRGKLSVGGIIFFGVDG